MRILIASLAALGRHDEARGVAGNLLAVQPNFRLNAYRPLCPFRGGDVVALMIDRLAMAGLPA